MIGSRDSLFKETTDTGFTAVSTTSTCSGACVVSEIQSVAKRKWNLADDRHGFTKELIAFALYGKLNWTDGGLLGALDGDGIHVMHQLYTRVTELQGIYKGIPNMFKFAPSSVSFGAVGIYPCTSIPQGTVLGPYCGRPVQKEDVSPLAHNKDLWEIYHGTSLLCCVDASDPKYGNWMHYIQCARHGQEQNLKALQYNNCLYFEATREIPTGEELLVWYCDTQYQLYMGIPIAYRGLEKKAEGETVQSHEQSFNQYKPTDQRLEEMDRGQEPASPGTPIPSTPNSGSLNSVAATEALECNATAASPVHTTSPETPTHSSSTSPCSSLIHCKQEEDMGGTFKEDISLPLSGLHGLPAGLSDPWPLKFVDKARAAGLVYGMFSRHEDGNRWQCEECRRVFCSQGSLRAHARIHTGERPYQCHYCLRAFCQASTLRSHERLHTGEKPYKCKYCGRAFTQSAGLRSHLKTHRPNNNTSTAQHKLTLE